MALTAAAMTTSPGPHPARVRALQADLGTGQLDALVVTHLPNLRYVTGFTGTAGAAVLTAARCVLIVDFRYATAAREVLAAQPDGVLDLAIVDRTYDDTLVDVLREAAALRIGVEGASMTVNRFRKLAHALAPSQSAADDATSDAILVATDRFIERRRAVKDAVEIQTLRLAARLLSRVARHVPPFVRPGRSELEVAADIDAAIRAAGFERPAFDTIVASGPNSARPHARPGGRILSPGDGVVLDFGGVYDGYCVDLTRTLHVGPASPDVKRLVDAVRRAHAAAIAAVKPGTRPSDIDAAARSVLSKEGLGEAFGHGTGHGLGLEVHEDPRISKLPGALPDDPVVPGMVFTIEPGAYVEGVGGVRIEDDVLVTEAGCEVLTDVPIEYE
jgi:Xaa-Pro aminopeptidase